MVAYEFSTVFFFFFPCFWCNKLLILLRACMDLCPVVTGHCFARAVLQLGEWAHSDSVIYAGSLWPVSSLHSPVTGTPQTPSLPLSCWLHSPDSWASLQTLCSYHRFGRAELELNRTYRSLVLRSAGLWEIKALRLNSFIISIVSVIKSLRNDTA